MAQRNGMKPRKQERPPSHPNPLSEFISNFYAAVITKRLEVRDKVKAGEVVHIDHPIYLPKRSQQLKRRRIARIMDRTRRGLRA